MQLSLTLCMPRDSSTVAVVRHLITYSLRELGVRSDCASDIELAISEACGNVVRHAAAEDEYEVRISVDESQCEVRVVDTGRGFDFASLQAAVPSAESGRGISLMNELVDGVRFESHPEAGTIVHLTKRLEFDGG